MTVYRYKARDKFGKLVEGVMEAESESLVAAKLKEINCLPVSVDKSKPGAGGIFYSWKNRISLSEINIWTRQFAALQKAGIPILSSLQALEREAGNKRLKKITGQVKKEVEAGFSLSEALKKYPSVFGPLYLNMVKTGEVSGRLEEVLNKLAELGEYQEGLRQKVQAAVRYPLMVLGAMVIGFIVLVTFVVPRFSHVYGQFTTALPLPTRVLLGLNFIFLNYWWLLILGAGGTAFFLKRMITGEKGKLYWDSLKLKMPVFGPLFLKLSLARFAYITAALLSSGIPLQQVLELASESAGNELFSEAITRVKKSLKEGKGLTEPMRESGLFPSVALQMVAAGEKSGKLDELLRLVSDYYQLQVKNMVDNLTSLIEPILIFFLGLGVLFMALGIFLPMWDVIRVWRG